jgi:hypothetical protein
VAFLNLLLLVASGAFPAQATAAAPSSVGSPLEYQVKAAYILNFVNLTEWPPSALGQVSTPFRLCVAGSDPFRGVLESTVKGETVMGHPIVVERVARGAAQTCQVVFVPGDDAAEAAEIVRTLGSGPVLTIGEGAAFLHAGGVVSFAVEQGHVRFDVSRGSAERHGLTLSSRLLRVARSVRQ